MNGQSPYSGPVVVLTEDEIAPLADLLLLNPRPWNWNLRERIKHAEALAKPPQTISEQMTIEAAL